MAHKQDAQVHVNFFFFFSQKQMLQLSRYTDTFPVKYTNATAALIPPLFLLLSHRNQTPYCSCTHMTFYV